MTDPTPRSPDRKLSLLAPLLIGLVTVLILLAVVVFDRDREPEPAPAPPPPAVAVAPAPAVIAPTPPLTRADLVSTATALAAAYSAGDAAAPAVKSPLAGRAFRIRIPFGCQGPRLGYGAAQAFYELDPEARTLRLIARPGEWTSLPLFQQALETKAVEAVEGFWIPRPWSTSESCPPERPRAVPATPSPPAAPSLGLARLFAAEDSRIGRRATRGYQKVIKLEEDAPQRPPQGFRLLLEGRIGTFPDGRPARCWSESIDHRPVCIFAVSFDRVAFEAGDNGQLLAEWRD